MKSFSLFELVIIVGVLGILAALAIPQYANVDDNKEGLCRAYLSELRSGITIFYASKAVETGTATWPTLEQLCTKNAVIHWAIPSNPYQHPDNAPDSVVRGTRKGEQVVSRGGWVYNPQTGEIWPNTNVNGECVW